MADLLAETEGLDEAAFLERYPYPFLVREATKGPQVPSGGGSERRTTRLTGKAAAPAGDGFMQGDVRVHPVCPADPDNFDGAVTLGRDAGCDVVVDDGSISAHHADFTLEFEGEEKVFYVADVGSANGTFVNGEAVPASGRARIEDQDSIRFGPAVKFQFFQAAGFREFLEFYRRIKR
jgi:hypothetical protein